MRYEGFERTVLTPEDESYPSSLIQIPDPPKSLHLIGNVGALTPSLSIVGARKATPYGLACARMFAERTAALGIAIVSGAAVGCDQEAMRASLSQRGTTVAVLACGADVIYPSSARGLLEEVLEGGGVIVSEQDWTVPPLPYFFVRRNRIIAGLSRATLIVEAGLGSGTFSTADAALSAGREVLVVPGCIHSLESKGSNRLLFQGAQPIVDMETFDIVLSSLFDVLPLSYSADESQNARAGLSPEKASLVAMLSASPMHADAIAVHMQKNPNETSRLIVECEAIGLIERYRDGRYGVPVLRR
ncbi:MAG: DNA-protecting protein DprA [Actinobacteria bacterium]|nr:DNA-protecting protein DprA [Actinomycetota bacterium]